ncbi:hypothetical protein [Nostoc punctiforme]|uniref:hypothetical protein n=1 Tax=Nostoc punctiforme TaxID=272131 RepID=UPI000045BADB|nr:hypothetical protein [Nostoc punctiforme]
MQERGKITQTHRYYSTTHQMKPVSRVHTGECMRSPSLQKPPKELAEAMGTAIPPALQTVREELETQ